jgi:hypothetical protein
MIRGRSFIALGNGSFMGKEGSCHVHDGINIAGAANCSDYPAHEGTTTRDRESHDRQFHAPSIRDTLQGPHKENALRWLSQDTGGISFEVEMG